MKFSCCIEMLFTEYPFVERVYQAKKAGFDAVEFWTWEDKDLAALKKALGETGLEVGVFQGNMGGRMVDAGDRAVYIEGVKRSAEAAGRLGAKALFLMSDILREDRSVLEADKPLAPEEKLENARAVLEELAPIGRDAGICFLIEPLNTLVDHRGYSLCKSAPAFRLVKELHSPNVKVLYDAYHMQIMEGNIIDAIRAHIEEIGYFHMADVPGRCEPGTGEMNYRNILKALESAGYKGTVGFEFSPSQGDSAAAIAKTWAQLK